MSMMDMVSDRSVYTTSVGMSCTTRMPDWSSPSTSMGADWTCSRDSRSSDSTIRNDPFGTYPPWTISRKQARACRSAFSRCEPANALTPSSRNDRPASRGTPFRRHQASRSSVCRRMLSPFACSFVRNRK
jgi:hypothetical protein